MELLEQITSDIIEEGLQRLKTDNSEYQQLLKERAILADKLEVIIDSLSEDDKKTVEDFITQGHMVFGVERVYLYRQGFKDCARLMRWLKD